ncbi:MAG: ABC transporter ATP-binding protein [Nitrospirae bacterium]|nr:ABC transporter ATP-binding protein [Nitrospirota bacterium]
MLRLKDIHTFYGPIEALKGISLEVGKGQIVCLLGGNGAGKSTALMTISGVLKPKAGEIYFDEAPIHKLPPHEIVQMGISHVPEGRRIFPGLTVRENLEMGAYSLKPKKSEFTRVFELFPLLKERQKQYGGTLSGGEQQMLAIGRALMSGPRLLLMDEPSLGLSPILVTLIFKTIKEINSQGVTVLLVEQNAMSALRLSEKGYVLEGGKVALTGRGEELIENEEVKKAYLGNR